MWTISRIIISGSVYHYSLTSSFPRNSRSFEATRRRLQALTDVYQPADNYFSCALLLIILRCVHKARADGTAVKDSKTAGISCTSLRTPECPIRNSLLESEMQKKKKRIFMIYERHIANVSFLFFSSPSLNNSQKYITRIDRSFITGDTKY